MEKKVKVLDKCCEEMDGDYEVESGESYNVKSDDFKFSERKYQGKEKVTPRKRSTPSGQAV